MLIEISYMDGRCPLCGGTASQIDKIGHASDLDSSRNESSYVNFTTYAARCSYCSFLWYVRTYSWIQSDKNGFGIRRNYVDHVDYNSNKQLFNDMAYLKEGMM